MKKVKQLLLIEDDQVAAFLSQTTIEEIAIAEDIVVCENGKQALDYLKKSINATIRPEIYYPELIFLDLNMPVMDGYEFFNEFIKIEELKEKNIHVIIVSSASREKEQKRIQALPASAYIEKPIDENKLVTVLASLHF